MECNMSYFCSPKNNNIPLVLVLTSQYVKWIIAFSVRGDTNRGYSSGRGAAEVSEFTRERNPDVYRGR
jgi:hypothetical protein